MAVITGTSSTETLDGTAGVDTINGLAGNDTLSGLGGNDTLDGGSGNDRLIGGLGVDTIIGGFGNDTIVITDQTEIAVGENYSGGSGIDTLAIEVATLIDIQAIAISNDIEVLSAFGEVKLKAAQLDNFQTINTAGAITLANAGVVNLTGAHVFTTTFNLSALGNTLNLTGVTDTTYTVIGGNGVDIITGGDDVRFGAGDDLRGGGGADTIDGGDGNDRLVGGTGGDTIVGGYGDDAIVVTGQGDIAAGETYNGGSGFDTLAIETASLVDIQSVTIGSDVEGLSNTFGGQVRLKSAQLDNFQTVNTGAITLTDAGVVNLTGAQVFTSTFTLSAAGNTLNLMDVRDSAYTVIGGNGADTITGGDLGDDLRGGANNDTVSGGAGNDTLNGGAGVDIVNGDAGDDTIVVSVQADVAAGETYNGGTGTDLLQFSPGSLIDFSAATINADIEQLQTGGAVKLTSSQLGNLSNVSTGAITLTDSGTADLTGATVSTSTFTLSAGGNTLILAGVGTTSYTVTGGAGADTVLGGRLANTLNGNGGADTLTGGDGDDVLNGGAAGDVINGGAGNDVILVNLQTDIAAGDNFSGGAGTDTLQLGAVALIDLSGAAIAADVERLQGSGAIKLTATQLGNFSDVSTGGAITLTSAGIADLTGARVFSGTINLSAAGNTLDLTGVTSQFFTVVGGGSNDLITGGEQGDDLRGGIGIDTLNGGGGNDVLTGGAGKDTMNGGLGNDTFVVALQTDIAAAEAYNGGDGVDTLKLTAGSIIDLSTATINADVEHLEAFNAVKLKSAQLDHFHSINTSGFAITLTDGGIVDFFEDRLVFPTTFNLAAAGNQVFFSGQQTAVTVNGGAGQDTISGGSNADILNGGANNDTIHGDGDNDTITGGTGADTLMGDGGDDIFRITTQTDIAAGESYAGGDGNDTLLLTPASLIDLTLATIGSDVETLQATGPVKLSAAQLSAFGVVQTGSITLSTSGTADLSGDQVLNNMTFTLNAAGNTIDLTGVGDARYTVQGNSGNDVIIGGDHEFGDDLRGGNGNDTINGGEGTDLLNGGANQDTFVFSTALNASNVDTITGYSVAEDIINLDDAVFTGLAAGTLAGTEFVIGSAALDGDDHIIYDSGTGALLFDVDGTGATAAVQFATVATGLAMNAGEFFVI